jgi:hypothetical protein
MSKSIPADPENFGFFSRNLGTKVFDQESELNKLIDAPDITEKTKENFEDAIKTDVEKARKNYTLALSKNTRTPSSDSRSKLADAKLRLDKFEEIQQFIKKQEKNDEFVNNVLAFRTNQMRFIKKRPVVTKTTGKTPDPELASEPFQPIDETAGKEITIKFIQHAATNQCFIKEYNICDVLDVKKSIGVDEDELPSRLVLDMTTQPVIENIQSMNTIMIKNCTPTSSPSPAPAPALSNQAQPYTGATSVSRIGVGGYNSTRSVTKSRKSMKPRKTSKYSPYNKFMRNTTRNRRRKPFL